MSFASIIGHERPVSILKRAIGNDALAHAYLFSGEQGIGKSMTAHALAAALNCAAPSPDGGCGACPSCRKTAARSHPDVHVLVPDGAEIKIDQVRAAQSDLSLRPFEGRRKVLIVDNAETLNEASSNAFLKTLEEPPGESLIILVTSMPQSLLITIRSRCQELKFNPLPRKVLAEALRRLRSLDEGDALFLAALSRGSLGRALSMDSAEEKQAREQVAGMLESLPALRHDEVLALAEGIAKDRDGFERMLDMGVELLRDRLVLLETGDERLQTYPGGTIRDDGAGRSRILSDLDRFTASRTFLERRVSAQLVAEDLLLKLRNA